MKVQNKGGFDGDQLSVFITTNVKKVKQSIHLSYRIHVPSQPMSIITLKEHENLERKI